MNSSNLSPPLQYSSEPPANASQPGVSQPSEESSSGLSMKAVGVYERPTRAALLMRPLALIALLGAVMICVILLVRSMF